MNRFELAESFREISRCLRDALAAQCEESFFEKFSELAEQVFLVWPEEGGLVSESHHETDVLQESFRCWIQETQSLIYCGLADRVSLQSALSIWRDRFARHVASYLVFVSSDCPIGDIVRATPLASDTPKCEGVTDCKQREIEQSDAPVPSKSRRGRLPKEEKDILRAQFMATIREHPTMVDSPGVLASSLGMSESTVRRWIDDERKKYARLSRRGDVE
jgi:hypothetical protein